MASKIIKRRACLICRKESAKKVYCSECRAEVIRRTARYADKLYREARTKAIRELIAENITKERSLENVGKISDRNSKSKGH